MIFEKFKNVIKGILILSMRGKQGEEFEVASG